MNDAPVDPSDLDHRCYRLAKYGEWITTRLGQAEAWTKLDLPSMPFPKADANSSAADIKAVETLRAARAANEAAARTAADASKAILRRWRESPSESDALWSHPTRLLDDLVRLGSWAIEMPAVSAVEDDAIRRSLEHWIRHGVDAPGFAIRQDLHGPPGLRLVDEDPERNSSHWLWRYSLEVRMHLAVALHQDLHRIAAVSLPTTGLSASMLVPSEEKGVEDHGPAIQKWLAGLQRFDVFPVHSWWRGTAVGLVDHLDNGELVSLANALSLQPPVLALLEAADRTDDGKNAARSRADRIVLLTALSKAVSPETVAIREGQLTEGRDLADDLTMIQIAMTSVSPKIPESDHGGVRRACQRQFDRLVHAPLESEVVPRDNAYEIAIQMFRIGILVDLRTHAQIPSAVAWAILKPVYEDLLAKITGGKDRTISRVVSSATIRDGLFLMGLHLTTEQLHHQLGKYMAAPAMTVQAILESLRAAQGQSAAAQLPAAVAQSTVSIVRDGKKKGDWRATIAW